MELILAAIYIVLFLILLVVIGVTYTLLCEVIKNAEEIRKEMKKSREEETR